MPEFFCLSNIDNDFDQRHISETTKCVPAEYDASGVEAILIGHHQSSSPDVVFKYGICFVYFEAFCTSEGFEAFGSLKGH